jgi:hypothetical protein
VFVVALIEILLMILPSTTATRFQEHANAVDKHNPLGFNDNTAAVNTKNDLVNGDSSLMREELDGRESKKEQADNNSKVLVEQSNAFQISKIYNSHGNGDDTGNGNEDANGKANAATTLSLITCESRKTMRDLLDWNFTAEPVHTMAVQGKSVVDVKVLNYAKTYIGMDLGANWKQLLLS